MNRVSSLLLGSALATASLMAIPSLGWAQTTASAANASGAVGEVVVTARRSAERAQDIPVAVTALSTVQLQVNQIQNLNDVANYTPGLRFTGFLDSFNGNVTIRGLQQTNVQNAVGNVGVFLDGIYLQRGYMTDASLGDFQRIEVEKGPQTALFGQNTFGGALNYVTRQPTDDYHFDGEASVGNAGLRSIKTGLGGPIVKGILDARIYYAQSDYAGTWNNNTPNVQGEAAHFGAYNKQNFSAGLKFTPTDKLTITASYYDLHKTEEILPFYTIDGNSVEDKLNCGSIWCGALPTDPAATKTGVGHPPTGLFTEPQPDTVVDTVVYRAGLSYRITDDLTLNYIYGNVHGSALEQASFATNAYNPTGVGVISSQREGGDLKADSHEIRLVYAGESPFKGEVGYFHSHTNDFFLFGFDSFANPVGQAIKSTGSSPTCTTCTALLFTEQDSTYDVDSPFGRLSYNFLDHRANFSVEMRYTSTKISENDLLAHLTQPSLPLLQATYGDFTPKITADFKITPNNMIYASVAEGVKAGGFNGYVTGSITLGKAEQSFGEESNWTYEAGWKASLFDHKLTFAADVFYVDWINRQISVTPVEFTPALLSAAQGTALPGIYQASGNATDYGFELNGDYRPVTGLDFNYSLSLQNPTDSSGAQYLNATLYCKGGGCPTTNNISGHTIGNVPKVSSAFGVDYHHSVANLPHWIDFTHVDGLEYFGGINEVYRGKIFTDDLNVTSINEYWLTDGHFGFQRGQVRLFAWVKNMFDLKYVESSFVVPSIKQYNVDFGERRTIGMTLSASF
jgi:iron complex outermembrane receptor protein